MMKTIEKTQTYILDGFVVVNNSSNEVEFFGSRRNCREWRASQETPSNYSGPQRVNADIPTN